MNMRRLFETCVFVCVCVRERDRDRENALVHMLKYLVC